MNRRDLFHPRQLARSAGHVLSALEEMREPPPAPVADYPLLRLARQAMATTFEVLLPFGTPFAVEAGGDAFDLIDRLEEQMTVYRDSSDMSRINRLAPLRPVPVEPRLFDLLAVAARIHAETEGAYDVAVGALIKAWGFFRGPRRVPAEAERQAVLQRCGMRQVVLEPGSRSVRYLRKGVEINLGSIGKGYALDRVAELLRRKWKIRAALLHGGHSSVYARGCPPGQERGWVVGVRHPWDRERRLAEVYLRDRALGTSAATFQHLEHEGRKLGHILDPRTGWPASGLASVSVVAPTAAEADALSTAFYVGGIEVARRYCEAHPGIGALLLPEDARSLIVLGLQAHDVTLL